MDWRTGGLAHDFNNLLNVVIGNYVVPALKAFKRGASLIKPLLASARKQPLLSKPVNIGDLVGGARRLLQRKLPSHISIGIAPMVERLYAMTDVQQLKNALLDLALNARDAMPGGGQLAIRADRLQMEPAQAIDFDVVPGCYLNLSVLDTGTGMDAAAQARALSLS